MPAGMSFPEAAAFPVVYPTSYAALVLRANLRAGETLLVHAAAGGVGVAAVQIGKALGARVIATAGGADKLAVARRAGADLAIDYSSGDWVEAVRQATGGRGADVIYDSVGGDTFDRSRRCIAFEGRILVLGFSGGRIAELPTNHAMLKNYSVVGVYPARYAQLDRPFLERVHEELLRLLESGAIDPLIRLDVPLEGAADAIRSLTDRKTVGKVIVRVASSVGSSVGTV
jgi:NADPH2:quinone reductase